MTVNLTNDAQAQNAFQSEAAAQGITGLAGLSALGQLQIVLANQMAGVTSITASNDGDAQALFQSEGAAYGLNFASLDIVSQLQLAVASLLVGSALTASDGSNAQNQAQNQLADAGITSAVALSVLGQLQIAALNLLAAVPDAAQSTFTFDPYALTADGTTLATAAGAVNDSAGNPLSGVVVTTTATACTVDGTASTLVSSLTAVANTDVAFTVTLIDNESGDPIPDIAAADISVNGDTGATISSFTGSTDSNGQISGLVQWSTNGAKSMTCAVLPSGANVSITGWTCTVSGAGSAYPNEPAGLTPIAQFDGSPRETANKAFGYSWTGPWFWESGSRTEDESLIVTADVTNPTGSNNVLRFIWTPGTVASIKSAKIDPANFPSTYSTLYVMLRIYWEADTWDNTGHKFFYVGLPTSDKHFYVTRDLNGAGKMTTEGYAGAAGNIINLPTGTFVDGSWNNIEFVLHASGTAAWYLNGSLIGSATGVNWNSSNFGTFEWYATNNSIPDVKHYRIGELYMSAA